MKIREFVCCLCGRKCIGWGNNPNGAMGKDKEGNTVELTFNPKDECCDDCNARYVIPGRLYKMNRGH